jgi:hypothetical protein
MTRYGADVNPIVFVDCIQTLYPIKGTVTPVTPGRAIEFDVPDVYGRPWAGWQMKSLLRSVLCTGVLMMTTVAPAMAQQAPAAQLLDQTVAAMGGRDKLLGVGTLVYTGFGQDAYMDGGGNITAEPNAPPKWRAIADAQRSLDLKAGRALPQQRRAPMFPFAAPRRAARQPG